MGFLVNGDEKKVTVRQGDFKMMPGRCMRPWRAAGAKSGEEWVIDAEQLTRSFLRNTAGTKNPGKLGRKREEKSGEEGSLRGRKVEAPRELQVSKSQRALQPNVMITGCHRAPNIYSAPTRHNFQGKSPWCVRRGECGF